MFYTENQGPWNGACALKHLKPGAFLGNPVGHQVVRRVGPDLGRSPPTPKSGSRMAVEAEEDPRAAPARPSTSRTPRWASRPAGSPATRPAASSARSRARCSSATSRRAPSCGSAWRRSTAGTRGPASRSARGSPRATCRCCSTPDGSMFVGGTNRGWGSRGRQAVRARAARSGPARSRSRSTTMHARPDGFELTFTEPVDPTTAGDPKSYTMRTHTYIYQAELRQPRGRRDRSRRSRRRPSPPTASRSA